MRQAVRYRIGVMPILREKVWAKPVGDRPASRARPLTLRSGGDRGRWDTGALGRDQSARITFPEAGTSRYVCAFHPHMRAQIIVLPD